MAQKKGFEVEKATSVKAAIQIYEKTESGFDLVLSDLRLPDHDGIFLLQWMRKHGMLVPFIVMTSYAEIQNVVLAMKSGATDYVAKPFQPDILLDKIKEAIKAPKKTQNTSTTEDKNTKVAAPAGDVPKYLRAKAKLPVSSIVSFLWWPLPLCRFSF